MRFVELMKFSKEKKTATKKNKIRKPSIFHNNQITYFVESITHNTKVLFPIRFFPHDFRMAKRGQSICLNGCQNFFTFNFFSSSFSLEFFHWWNYEIKSICAEWNTERIKNSNKCYDSRSPSDSFCVFSFLDVVAVEFFLTLYKLHEI